MSALHHIEASDGYALTYRTWPAVGSPRATLVLLNGIMSNSAWFEPVAPLVCAAGFHIVGADRRGSGPNAEGWGDAPSAERLVLDASAIAASERFLGAPLVLVGWCWGAALALNVTAKLAVDGLVLVTPGMRNTPALEQAVVAQKDIIASSPEDSAVVESPVREEWFTDGPQLEAFIRRDPHRVLRMTPRMLDVTRRLATGAALRLRKLDRPILLILAEHDEATDNAATRAMFHGLPHVDTVTLPTRHGVQFDAPESLASHIIAFVERFTAPQEHP